ncbi:hypothetical protein P3T24_006505 [Paraburkholderia sp. GAS33]|uniref:hypothetical protein n=1 Tax=Paraburkholderia sp. GAS33 TaxID=3035130 RepID=UPI003D1AAFCD
MDREQVSERLATLAAQSEGRSKAARLRDVIEDIEAALHAGVAREVVVRELSVAGLDFTLPTFALTIKRIRKARRANNPVEQGPTPRVITQRPVAPAAGTSVSRVSGGSGVGAVVPDDWLIADLTPAQYRLLSTEQKQQKRKAAVEKVFPNPYKKLT